MADSIEFNSVPFDGENDAEALFWHWLDALLSHLVVERVRSSCARERAVLKAVSGAYDATGNLPTSRHPRRVHVFDRLGGAFGWVGDESELLAMWLGLCPSIRYDLATPNWRTRDQRAVELLASDPYSRHVAFWNRCEKLGFDSFMRYWGHQADPFAAVLALIDGAAKALGDE